VRRAGLALAVMVLAALVALPHVGAQAEPVPAASERFPVPVYLFWGIGCPHCENQKRYFEGLADRFPSMRVHLFEVYQDAENRALLQAMAAAFGRDVTGVPMTFIGDEAWVGFSDTTGRQMAASIEAYSSYRAPDPLDRLGDEWHDLIAPPVAAPASDGAVLELPIVGALDLSHRPLLMGTALIALVDGFNPCSLWVLALLLGVVINTRSRRRVVLVGVVFLTVTAAAYGLFIAGLFTIMSFVQYLVWIRVAVALLAGAFAFVNIKDYFAYRRGFSLTIDDSKKPGIYRSIRNVMSQRGSVPATVAATAGMALGITLVELPCTAGLPVLWTGLVTDAAVGVGAFAALLMVYIVIYLLLELIVFGTVVVTMRAGRLEERGGRVLKLVGGSVMLALALAMLFWPAALESVSGMLVVFGAAIGGSLLVVLLHRVVHPASSPLGPPQTSK
jgi:glutaredoxin